ncbi:Bax inhibitor-1/YccA family protein [Flaviaesturariibacter flavus]|uniref:Bax inhibitor-1/YccA family protein n=1 Tax=Flaviaesturariibacter flavus TaxID=2502780 RepID=A0A4R1BLB8_9BACT|nr:Bax inhibitor-1/YccA family protein [Flaviaesturariibacter flavus]TCJ18225.1 Bax inhibitor-1/YccA family protein [Flaviaesturariibacter flavus]
MSIFKGGNPALNEKTFDNATFSNELEGLNSERMTVRGAAGKFGAMMIMLLLAAAFGWLRIAQSPDATIWMFGSMIVGTILAFVIIFKKEWAPQLALGYALCEGIFLGTVSAIVNTLFEAKYPGIAGQAVLLTLGVAVAMFGLYYFRILKATPIFTKVVLIATMGIAIFYLIDLVLHWTGNGVPFLHDSSPLSIGISLFIVGIAALNFVLDFAMIERGAEAGAPKQFEWYGAFALTVTIVWLYLEMLKLLMKLANRK